MTTRTRLLAPRARPALWAAALFVVLAGLFGMHGLGDHGMPGMAQAPASGSMAHPAGPHRMTDHPDQPMVGAHANVMVRPAHDAMPSLGPVGLHGHSGMAGMCLALLTGGLLALLLHRGRAVRVLAEEPRRSLTARHPRSRDPDPPCLASLSILRC
ncbi:MAG: DUF6153 family protein [Nocardioidaceae bacterium]